MPKDEDALERLRRKQDRKEIDGLLNALLKPTDKEVPFYCPQHGKHLVTPMGDKPSKKRPCCSVCDQPMQTEDEHLQEGNLRQKRRRAIRKAWNYLEGDH